MSIPAVNVTYNGAAPVAGGSTILAFGGTSMQELSYIGTATFVLDGSLTTAALNYIDGTNALSFTPKAVLCARIGGNATNSIVAWASDNADGGKTANVQFSAAGSNLMQVAVAVFVLK